MGEIKTHTEIIVDPFRGRDMEHDRLLATTRKAAFQSIPFMVEWVKRNMEDRFNEEITITAVMGQMVLSNVCPRGFFTQTPLECVSGLANGIAGMVAKLLTGQMERPEESRIVKPGIQGVIKNEARRIT